MSQSEASTVPAKPRGRPKAYDRAAAMTAMRRVFWTKGFAATSLDDISAATGMNRPSLYNAFGDKTEAFRAVLKDYIDDARLRFIEAFRAPVPLREGLAKVYEAAIAIYHNPESQGMGCFMIGAALTDAKRDPVVGAMILDAFKEMEAGFVRRFEKARDAGELPADANVRALARIASAGHNTISVRMRAGEGVDDIRLYLDQMIDIMVR